jgi:hypothetical protein
MASVRVCKQKYPARPHLTSELEVIGTDSFGAWLYRPRDASLDRVGVQLMPHRGWWTAWWWIGWTDDPGRRWIAVDICTPPTLKPEGWQYDDLEIDLVRLADGSILVLDEDEFEQARRSAPYSQEIVTAALRARDDVHRMLEQGDEPFRSHGWRHLETAGGTGSP